MYKIYKISSEISKGSNLKKHKRELYTNVVFATSF
jgi:hypothetical protein